VLGIINGVLRVGRCGVCRKGEGDTGPAWYCVGVDAVAGVVEYQRGWLRVVNALSTLSVICDLGRLN
jgi:hypothetical protein